MSVTSGFYNSLNHDRKYNAGQITKILDGVINDGVFVTIGSHFVVLATTGMTVSVGTGRAWFNQTWTDNDSPYLLTLAPSELILNRIDAVVIETNSSVDVRDNRIKIVKGVPGADPSAPTLTNTTDVHQYPLCYVNVGAGVTTIGQGDIVQKVGTEACPYVTGILQTSTVEAQTAAWEAKFNTWFDTLVYTLSGDVAGNLQNEVNDRVKYSDKASQGDLEDGSSDTKFITPVLASKMRVIIGSSPPTQSTVGTVGQIYFNTDTKKTYRCVNVSGSVYTWEGPLEYVKYGAEYKQFRKLVSTFIVDSFKDFGDGAPIAITPDKTKMIVSGSNKLFLWDLTASTVSSSPFELSIGGGVRRSIVYDDMVLVLGDDSTSFSTVNFYRIENNQLIYVTQRTITSSNTIACCGFCIHNQSSSNYRLFMARASDGAYYVYKANKMTYDITTVTSLPSALAYLVYDDYVICAYQSGQTMYVVRVKSDGTQTTIASATGSNGLSCDGLTVDEDGILYCTFYTYNGSNVTTYLKRVNIVTGALISSVTIERMGFGLLAYNRQLCLTGQYTNLLYDAVSGKEIPNSRCNAGSNPSLEGTIYGNFITFTGGWYPNVPIKIHETLGLEIKSGLMQMNVKKVLYGKYLDVGGV